MIFVELGDCGFQRQFAASDLQTLDEVRGAGEQRSPAIFHQCQANRRRQMAFASAWRTGLIMPNISEAVAKCRSAMRSTLAFTRRSLSLAGNVIAGRQLMWGANLTAAWR